MAKLLLVTLTVLVLSSLAFVAFADSEEIEVKLPACHVDGYHVGHCIDNNKVCCDEHHGEVFVDGDHCPGYSQSAHVVCCAKKGPKVVPKKVPKKKAPKKSPKGWSRADCVRVAEAWLAHKGDVYFGYTPKVKQFITYGKGNYRTDCSGFVSAAWDKPPPGWVTWTFQYQSISRRDLKQCDALLCNGCNTPYGVIGHVALFWGRARDGRAIMVEEHTHGTSIVMRPWYNSWFDMFKPIRRHGW